MIRILRLVTFLSTGVATLTAATLTGFTPIVGEPGVQVTISGSGLATATEVRFEDTVADFTAVDNNRIVAVVPLEAMTGPIRVKFPPSTTINTSSSFTVAPRITEFSPTRGATNTTVLIYGANLLSVTNVPDRGSSDLFSCQLRHASHRHGAVGGHQRTGRPDPGRLTRRHRDQHQ